MPWARLDDAFYTHRKVLDLSPSARWLYVAAICYSNQNTTNGIVSPGAAESVGMIKQPRKAIAELLKAELWHRHPDGYEIHDYLKYQLSRDQILKARESAAERQSRRRRGGNGQYSDDEPPEDPVTEPVSHGVTDSVTHDVNPPEVTTTPFPYPPSVSGSHPQTTSSCGEPDKPDDETSSNRTKPDRLATAEAACDLLADQAHADAVARGVVLRPGPHLKACRQSARTDYLAEAQLLAYRQPGFTVEELAAELTATNGPDLVEVPTTALYHEQDQRRREYDATAPEPDKVTNLSGVAAARAALLTTDEGAPT